MTNKLFATSVLLVIIRTSLLFSQLTAAGHSIDAYAQSAVYRAIGPSTASRLGAVAVIVRSAGGEDLRLPHTGLTVFEEGVTPIPAAAVTSEDADLIALLAQQGSVVMRLTLTAKNLPPAEGYNVIADWKGSRHPEQIVLVSGHLDSWDLGTGALDDGGGVVIGMETILLMHTLNLYPKRTIRFVAWMNEEQGITDAATYVADHAGEIKNHIDAIENDRGADHSFGIIFNGSSALAEYQLEQRFAVHTGREGSLLMPTSSMTRRTMASEFVLNSVKLLLTGSPISEALISIARFVESQGYGIRISLNSRACPQMCRENSPFQIEPRLRSFLGPLTNQC
jgi:hypothetical protein